MSTKTTIEYNSDMWEPIKLTIPKAPKTKLLALEMVAMDAIRLETGIRLWSQMIVERWRQENDRHRRLRSDPNKAEAICRRRQSISSLHTTARLRLVRPCWARDAMIRLAMYKAREQGVI